MLDTCAFIDLEFLDLGDHADGTPLLAAVTLGELAFGLELGDPAQRRARDVAYRDAIVHYEVLPFGIEEANLYGVLATLVRAAGRNPRPRRLDLQIAATAAAARVPLLTCNAGDFAGVHRLVDVVPLARPS